MHTLIFIMPFTGYRLYQVSVVLPSLKADLSRHCDIHLMSEYVSVWVIELYNIQRPYTSYTIKSYLELGVFEAVDLAGRNGMLGLLGIAGGGRLGSVPFSLI